MDIPQQFPQSVPQSIDQFGHGLGRIKMLAGRQTIIRDGNPVAVYIPPMDNNSINKMLPLKFQEDYAPKLNEDGIPLPGEERYLGKSKFEASVERSADKAAWGDQHVLEWFYDRTVGKPVQSIETVSMSMTYQDFVGALPEATEDELADVIEAEEAIYKPALLQASNDSTDPSDSINLSSPVNSVDPLDGIW